LKGLFYELSNILRQIIVRMILAIYFPSIVTLVSISPAIWQPTGLLFPIIKYERTCLFQKSVMHTKLYIYIIITITGSIPLLISPEDIIRPVVSSLTLT
jgi:hypothetical protein